MNLNAMQEAIRRHGLDGWLFFDHHRRDPLAYRILGIPETVQPTRRWYYLVPAEGEPRRLVHKIEAHALDAVPGELRSYARWMEQQDELKRLLSGMKRIAMEYSERCAIPYISLVDAGTLELVRSCAVEVVSSSDLVQEFEARWSLAQLDSHLQAGVKMDALRAAAFALITERIGNGASLDEHEVQQFLLNGFRENGMLTDHGPIVAVNANASDPHYEPSRDRTAPIHRGDFVLIDMWAKFAAPDSVYYDITWTGYCGPAVPEEIAKVFAVVSGGRDAAVEAVTSAMAAQRPLKGFEVDDVSRGFITDRGYGEYFFHRTGHSIGTEVHGTGVNIDNFETHDTRSIIPWTCFSIEPGVYLPNFGIRSEVNVFVGEGYARVTGEKQDRVLTLA
jgi:Xaa-Pro aminopeptidase